jgi:hypothetical protein
LLLYIPWLLILGLAKELNMLRSLALMTLGVLALGCEPADRQPAPPPAPKKGEIRIDAPGVKVDIERNRPDGKKVDIQVDPK